ncbi:MAG: DUF559 domain-containing protein [Propionibacteriaceae bacterium]|jgi:hypothetical protein|nr:DUF559 domain-containing protein [Propionibacteriaceae bacterium]
MEMTDGFQVTWRNYERLGYDRLTRGVYGHMPRMAGLDPYQMRRMQFLTRVSAVMEVYSYRDVVLYGPTALQVLRVELPSGLEDWERCHLLVRRETYRPERRGVVTHSTTRDWSRWPKSRGWPLLHPVDHWLQLRGSDDELIQAGDALLRRHNPLLTVDEFRARVDELAGTPGSRAARRVLKWIVPGTDSLYETRTRLVLVRAGLPEPVVNHLVICPSGKTYYLDMAYVDEHIAIEYDGAGHVESREHMEYDALRRRHLQDEGWLVITVTAQQLRSPADLVRSVETALSDRRR